MSQARKRREAVETARAQLSQLTKDDLAKLLAHYRLQADRSVPSWSPERKIVGAALAALVVGLTQQFAGFDLFPGAEAAIAVLVAYVLPNR